eukprot:g14972.t1
MTNEYSELIDETLESPKLAEDLQDAVTPQQQLAEETQKIVKQFQAHGGYDTLEPYERITTLETMSDNGGWFSCRITLKERFCKTMTKPYAGVTAMVSIKWPVDGSDEDCHVLSTNFIATFDAIAGNDRSLMAATQQARRWRDSTIKAFIQCARIAFALTGIYDPDEAERIAGLDYEPGSDIIEIEGLPISAPVDDPVSDNQANAIDELLDQCKPDDRTRFWVWLELQPGEYNRIPASRFAEIVDKLRSKIGGANPEWWQARRSVPTASRFSDICTPARGDYSESAGPYICELIADRLDPDYGLVEDYQSAAMRNGTILEPEARRFYEFDRSVKVEQVGLCMDDYSRFGCSPDGLCGDDGCLEIKSPMHKTQVKYLIDGGLPSEYKPQVHGHLVVTGRQWCDFLSYAQGLPHLLIRIVPDDYTDKLRACLNKFWDEYQAAWEKITAMRGPVPVADPEPEEVLF